MALMDAGVPIKKPVSGIAMGLIKEEDGVVVLSDILGDEDYLGDMDFKVAGTVDGITALQMDIKIGGITAEIMKKALAQANKGRLSILQEMALSITCARQSLNRHAPVISSINIPKDKIREIIGTGGKVIREICEVSGAKIDIEDSGKVNIAAVSKESGDKAMRMIANIVCEPEVGEIYEGKVVKVVDFGAFVNFMGSRDGLVHISELSDGRINKVEDIVREGDIVKVKLLAIDNRGKMKLSMRAVETIS
jgi:polyribonucleotide nucleotidyltransferase